MSAEHNSCLCTKKQLDLLENCCYKVFKRDEYIDNQPTIRINGNEILLEPEPLTKEQFEWWFERHPNDNECYLVYPPVYIKVMLKNLNYIMNNMNAM